MSQGQHESLILSCGLRKLMELDGWESCDDPGLKLLVVFSETGKILNNVRKSNTERERGRKNSSFCSCHLGKLYCFVIANQVFIHILIFCTRV